MGVGAFVIGLSEISFFFSCIGNAWYLFLILHQIQMRDGVPYINACLPYIGHDCRRKISLHDLV